MRGGLAGSSGVSCWDCSFLTTPCGKWRFFRPLRNAPNRKKGGKKKEEEEKKKPTF
jgi:hypothetical protein